MIKKILIKISSNIWTIFDQIIFKSYIYLNRQHSLNKRIKNITYKAKIFLFSRSVKSIGKNLFIDFPIIVHEADKIIIGDDVALGAYVLIWGGGGVYIGDRVMVAAHTVISSQTHDSLAIRPRWTSKNLPIIIEDDVWIGAGCIILPGVKIGKGSIIGAGSVVTRDVSPNVIAVGIPAKKLKNRVEKNEEPIN